MRNKTISLEEDLFEKLRLEENASALISKLLTEHYRDPQEKKTEEQIIKDVKTKISEKETEEQNRIAREEKQKIWQNKNDELNSKLESKQEFREGLTSGTWQDWVGFVNYKLEHDKIN